MKLRVKIIAIGGIVLSALLAIVLPIVFYVEKFGGNDLPDDPAMWGQAGDYFGGFLNPIIAFINLIVTIYIANELHRLSREQGKEQNEINRRVVTRQLQFQILSDYKNKFESDFEKISMNRMSIILGTMELQTYVVSFSAGPGQLFNCNGLLTAVSDSLNTICRNANEWAEEPDLWSDLAGYATLLEAQNAFITAAYREISDK